MWNPILDHRTIPSTLVGTVNAELTGRRKPFAVIIALYGTTSLVYLCIPVTMLTLDLRHGTALNATASRKIHLPFIRIICQRQTGSVPYC